MTATRQARDERGPEPPEAVAGELSPEIYRAFFDAAPDGCLVVDPRGRILEVNERALEMFGWSREELLGRPVERLVPERARAAHVRHRERFVRNAERRPMGGGLELRALRRDGTEFPVEIGIGPIEGTEGPEGPLLLAVVHDVSDRVRLREFGAGVIQGAEEERQRIARDLHDDTAQRLASLLLRLQMARRAGDGEGREALLAEMREEILQASEGVRRVLRGLRPPALEEAGLLAAVRAHVRTALADSGLRVTVDADDGEPALGGEARLALYRIIQEALSNVVRHADASRVRVRIAARGDRVCVAVVDDGCGFIPRPDDPAGRGLGILGMRERAALLGGRLEIESAPGEGTRVEVQVPVDGARAARDADAPTD